MLRHRLGFALPAVLALLTGSASASEIRDHAKLFGSDAVGQAQRTLDRIERDYKVPVVIESIESLEGEDIRDVSLRHARQSGIEGIYILIAKKETKLKVRDYQAFLGEDRRLAIERAFANGFRKQDTDGGLAQGVDKIRELLAAAGGTLRPQAPHRDRKAAPAAGAHPALPAPRGHAAPRAGGGIWGPLLLIAIVILVFFVVIRVLGSLFGGAGRAYGGPGVPGASGYGGGGGFLSSLFGGIGGAIAGNWLYDQFSGRRHDGGGYSDSSISQPDDASPAGGDWGGGDNADWGGGDTGGTDWGTGDPGGGGGDWGGGDGGGGSDW